MIKKLNTLQVNAPPQLKPKSVIIVSSDNHFIYKIKDYLKDFPDFHFFVLQVVNKFLELPIENLPPYLFLIDGNIGQNSTIEWTQTLKTSFENTPLIVFHSNKAPLNFELIHKNGANQFIHINFDQEFIIDLLLELVPYEFDGNNIPLTALAAVANNEINSELEINFDVFVHLPTNHKTILLRRKGSKLEESRLKKIAEHDQKVYFKKSEKQAFIEYSKAAQVLTNNAHLIAVTEKNLKTKKLIFQIMGEFFNQEVTDFNAGKNIFDRCKEIIHEYKLLEPHSAAESFQEMMQYCGEYRSFYNDAINLCVFSAHLGNIMGLSKEKIENLAIAGLLHNIGLSYLDNYDINSSVAKLSKSDQELYYSYPEKSVLMIKWKKVPLPHDVTEAILEHRENTDGTGFPKNKHSEKIHSLSKIIRVAYEFHILTAMYPNHMKKSPKSAVEEIRKRVLESNLPIDMTTALTLAKQIN